MPPLARVLPLILALAACGPAAPPSANSAPGDEITAAQTSRPRAGLWEFVVTQDGQAQPPVRICNRSDGGPYNPRAESGCATPKVFRRVPGGFTLDQACERNGATITLAVKVTGDFNAAFTEESVLTLTAPGQTRRVTGQVTARHVGDCP